MSNIPTAEEFLKGIAHHSQWNELTEVLQKFAKLHVQAALKAASEQQFGTVHDEDEYTKIKNSILNTYPLENIK